MAERWGSAMVVSRSRVHAPASLPGFLAVHEDKPVGLATYEVRGDRCEVVTAERRILDLARQAETEEWMREHRPEVVIVAAARVGGIAYNNAYPVDFLADNLAIELNLIRGAFAIGCVPARR